jgi:ribose transport system substrate-binding protein
MRRPFTRSNLSRISVVIALAFVLGIVLPGSVYGRTSGSLHAKVYKFVLSNNFLGNDWRPQMERLATLTAKLPPFKGQVTLSIQNAQTTTQAQIQSLNAIVATHPDAILLDAGSPTALNPTVQRACAAGIKVVSFDQPVTAACAWKVTQDHGKGQIVVGEWMAQVLHGKGNILVDRGLPGAPISKVIHDNFLKGLKIGGSAIKDVGEYDGGYAQGPEQQGISSLLVGHPNVNGVMTQGYCKPVFNAFKNAGKKAVPATCYAYNGELVGCQRGHTCAALTGSPVVVQLAMELALNAVQGKPTPSKSVTQPVPMFLYVTNKAQFHPQIGGVKIVQIQLGKNAYPSLAPGLALPITLARYPITPQQAAGR